MLCRKSVSCEEDRRVGSVPVYLNVYDLTPINGYAYWLGLGVYHSGVQVHGVEYAFGAHEYPTTGIFEAEPKQCEGFRFRKTVLIGKTDLEAPQVRAVMEELAEEYRGNAYNLISKNCNHFCNDACIKLTSNPIPSWVNRLARIGFLCNCVLPDKLKSTKVGDHHKIEDQKAEETDDQKTKELTNGSNRYISSYSSNSSPPSGRQIRGRTKRRSRRSKSGRALEPSSPLFSSSP